MCGRGEYLVSFGRNGCSQETAVSQEPVFSAGTLGRKEGQVGRIQDSSRSSKAVQERHSLGLSVAKPCLSHDNSVYRLRPPVVPYLSAVSRIA